MIKAIETEYNGYRFRSRLEARWAVFFDAYDFVSHWEYEPEGFDLGDAGWYLPDFKVTYHSGRIVWCEIKPKGTPLDTKMMAFRTSLGCLDDFGNADGSVNVWQFNGDPIDAAEPRLGMFDNNPNLHAAALKARSARFEYGQTPVIK